MNLIYDSIFNNKFYRVTSLGIVINQGKSNMHTDLLYHFSVKCRKKKHNDKI